MAIPSSAEDVGPSPQTCCATCGTVFEVATELLGSSDTRVRCGECYRIFDALANLVRDGAAGAGDGVTGAVTVFPGGARAANGASGGGDPGDGAALDTTYSDFDLFSEDADLPDVAYFDRTSETPEFDFDSVEHEDDETFSDTLFAHDVTIDPAAIGVKAGDPFALPPPAVELEVVEPAAPSEPLTFTYRDAEPPPDDGSAAPPGEPAGRAVTDEGVPAAAPSLAAPAVAPAIEAADTADTADTAPAREPPVPFALGEVSPARRRRRWPVVLMALALVGLLGGLHAWRVRDAPADDPFVRPVYVAACRVLGCEVPARVALERLVLRRRLMYEHPTLDGALVIDVAFRNDAPFEQRPPVLVVRLSNPSGQLVARRAFRPEEYLAEAAAAEAAADATGGGPAGVAAGVAADGAVAPGQTLDIRLEVTDPGRDASSFEIEFRES